MDDDKIAHAVDEVKSLIDELSEPSKMTREEAFEFYDAIVEEIGSMRQALKDSGDG